MGFQKYTALEVLSSYLAPASGSAPLRIMKDAHQHTFNYEPQPGYLYVRSRAISSRTNDNFDTFPAEEIKKAWATFIGKPVFVNHHNDNHRKSRGVVIDAALHEDSNPDGTPDTWVEVLMEIDAVRYPKLAQAIIARKIERTSMGTDVRFSVCSACGNKASNPLEYCQHIPRLKGKWIEQRTASGSKQRVLVHEICHGLGFFENSVLVEPPADPTAYFLGVEGMGITATAAKTFDGVGVAEDDDGFYVRTHRARSDSYPTKEDIPESVVDFIESTGMAPARAASLQMLAGIGEWIDKIPLPGDKQRRQEIERQNAQTDEWVDYMHQVLRDERAEGEVGGRKESAAYLPLQVALKCGHTIPYISSMRSMNNGQPKPGDDWDCEEHGPTTVVGVEGPDDYKGLGWDRFAASRRESTASIQSLWTTAMPGEVTPLTRGVPKKPKYADPGQHPAFQQLKVSSQNVMDHWNQATPEERAQGMRWYEDANHMANLMGMGNSDVAAGIMSAYSPQASWQQNLLNAARTIRTGHAPGKGEGAMTMHQKAAQRILNGEHWSKVLTAPKTYAFAHLITTGGKDPQTGATLDDVVIDRHALSVAAGRRVSDDPADERAMSNVLKNPVYYKHVADTYRDAAKQISAQEGHEVAPYQVQAATWLARQRLNHAEINASGGNAAKLLKGRDTMMNNYQKKWKSEEQAEWPGAFDQNMHAASLRTWAALSLLAGKDEHRPSTWRTFEPDPSFAHLPRSEWPASQIDDTPDDAYADGAADAQEGHPANSVDSYPTPEHADAYIRGYNEQKARMQSAAALRYLAYGEIKAPAEVDTLRDESCPICQDTDTFDGEDCKVCGYKAPPEQFRDPDLDKAKQVDLRKDREDEGAPSPLDGNTQSADGLALAGVEGR